MLKVYSCIIEQHNIALVIGAGVLSMIGTFTALNALSQALRERSRLRLRFALMAALATGMTIWSTHFVGMLSFDPGLPIAYEVGTTLLSVAVALGFSAVGVAIALWKRPGMPLAGGAIIGAGIAVMHHIGMTAMQIPGDIVIEEAYVAVAAALGVGLSATALWVHHKRPRELPSLAGSLLALAICSTHFTGMAAVTIYPHAATQSDNLGVSNQTLGIVLAIATQLILTIAGIVFMYERQKAASELQQAQERAALADELLRSAADREKLTSELRHQAEISAAALDNMAQGLSMYDEEDRLVIYNRRYADLYDIPAEQLKIGTPFADIREQLAKLGAIAAVPAEVAPIVDGVQDQEILLPNGRIIEFHRRPLPGGGWVATHEDVTQARRSNQQIAYLAAHDTLTGLPNRATFAAHLDAFARSGKPFAVHSIDLDRFKEVNDTLGHPVGDEILRGAAARLREVTGKHDIVTRLGGDEFAIIQAQAGGVTPAVLAGRIVERLCEPFEFDGHTIVIGASVGISLAPKDATHGDELLKMSDLALYCAKEASRGTYRFFESGMDSRLSARRQLEADLRVAITEGQFEVHYQPLLDTVNGRIGSFEALVRWRHPTRGLIPPADFIATAEESGLIIPIGEWVLREACRDAAGWPDDVSVAVNVSPAQFKRGDLIAMTMSALTAAGLAPSRLELEITEAVLLHDEVWVHAALDRLASLGVRIAMDDFGTGYSSLSYLRSFPFNKIKIDRSFVADLVGTSDALSIVQATIQLSQKLGMEITAEGVETAEQLHILASEGCTQVQGYHVSRPVPAGGVAQLLDCYNGVPETRARAAG